MSVLQPDPEILREAALARMPFGRYAGRRLVHVPEAYLLWFAREGWPYGKLGRQMALMLEIKTNGLEPLIEQILANENDADES